MCFDPISAYTAFSAVTAGEAFAAGTVGFAEALGAGWAAGTSSGIGGFGLITNLASTGLQAYSAMQASQAQQDAANYNAQVQRNNAQVAKWQEEDTYRRGAQAIDDHQRKVAALKGTQTASMAARGLDLSEGTPLNILTDTDILGKMDENTLKYNTEKEAWGHRVQSSNANAQAGLLTQQANNQNPWLTGAGTLMSGIGSVADKWYRYKSGNTGIYVG